MGISFLSPQTGSKRRTIYSNEVFANKGLSSQSYGFSSSHVWIWELDDKEGWVLKNWNFWTVALEKTLESSLDSTEIKRLNPKEINPEYSLKGLTLKLKLQYFGHLMWTANSLEKTLMLGKIEGWRRREQQDEMAGWHYWFSGHELGQFWEMVRDKGPCCA